MTAQDIGTGTLWAVIDRPYSAPTEVPLEVLCAI
jgi:hypothetical protein